MGKSAYYAHCGRSDLLTACVEAGVEVVTIQCDNAGAILAPPPKQGHTYYPARLGGSPQSPFQWGAHFKQSTEGEDDVMNGDQQQQAVGVRNLRVWPRPV